jgi:hypothetical protein
MSLAEQIAELEEELYHYQTKAGQLSNDLDSADSRIYELEYDCEVMHEFIAYIDATHPELRTAYEAARLLSGDKP